MNRDIVSKIGQILSHAGGFEQLSTSELLALYASLTDVADEFGHRAGTIAGILKSRHAKEGDVQGHGVKVYGGISKRIDHQSAVDALVDANPDDDDLLDSVSDIIEKFTTTKETTAWASVTKGLGIDLEPFTTKTPVVKVKYPA